MTPIPTKELNQTQISHLIEASLTEGFNFLVRLVEEWESGKNRFDKPNERLYQIEVEGEIIGIGGINNDPYCDNNKNGRIRHLYIHPDHRGKGFGKMIVQMIIADFSDSYEKFTLRTKREEAAKFYEAIGFTRVHDSKTNTHEMLVARKPSHLLSNSFINSAMNTLNPSQKTNKQ